MIAVVVHALGPFAGSGQNGSQPFRVFPIFSGIGGATDVVYAWEHQLVSGNRQLGG